jgi:hypothetical protein
VLVNGRISPRLSRPYGFWGEEAGASLLEDLAAAAAEKRKMRIGADEKSKTLILYARLLKPISARDANAIFNYAVDAPVSWIKR